MEGKTGTNLSAFQPRGCVKGPAAVRLFPVAAFAILGALILEGGLHAAEKPPTPPPESPELIRKTIEARYTVGAQALMSGDLKSFSSLKTKTFQCRLPPGVEAGTRLSSAPTLSAIFWISSMTFKGDQVLVDNVAALEQGPKGTETPVRSRIKRLDIWVKSEGAWKLDRTERVGFEASSSLGALYEGGTALMAAGRSVAPSVVPKAPKPRKLSLEESQAADERIGEACRNEIGILCFPARENIPAAKACLKTYEDAWLSACRSVMVDPNAPEEVP